MTKNSNPTTERRDETCDALTALVVWHPGAGQLDGGPAVSLTKEQQLAACRVAANKSGLRIIAETPASKHVEQVTPDGFRYYDPQGITVDAVLHAPERAAALPGITALVISAYLERRVALCVELVRIDRERSLA